MTITYRLNGERVTKEQFDAHQKRREELFGKDYFDFKNWNGKVPTIRTNDMFMRGKKNSEHTAEDFDRTTFTEYKRMAERAGVSTDGKFYFGQAARYAGDPEA